jgi:hypothetical protein
MAIFDCVLVIEWEVLWGRDTLAVRCLLERSAPEGATCGL